MGLEEYRGVYVFAQQVDNELSGIAFELLGKAKDLAKDLDTDVTAVLVSLFKFRWLRNFYRMCIAYASRPELSSRLTLGGRTFPKKP